METHIGFHYRMLARASFFAIFLASFGVRTEQPWALAFGLLASWVLGTKLSFFVSYIRRRMVADTVSRILEIPKDKYGLSYHLIDLLTNRPGDCVSLPEEQKAVEEQRFIAIKAALTKLLEAAPDGIDTIKNEKLQEKVLEVVGLEEKVK